MNNLNKIPASAQGARVGKSYPKSPGLELQHVFIDEALHYQALQARLDETDEERQQAHKQAWDNFWGNRAPYDRTELTAAERARFKQLQAEHNEITNSWGYE